MPPSSCAPPAVRARVHRLIAPPLLCVLSLSGCASALDQGIADAISAPAGEVAARHGADPMAGDPQTLMTRLRPERPGDAERAERLAERVRRSIARYRNAEAAELDGYRSFPPEPPPDLRIVHYTHPQRSGREAERIDPGQPGALLYERAADGGLRLVGAMFTAPVDAPLEELDRRVQLSVTQWHLHQNICIPRPIWDKEKWGRKAPGGKPVFGPGGAISSEAGCERVEGRFLPTVFGWMAHVYVFADDPADVWNAMYGHGETNSHGAEPHQHGSG